MKEDDEARIRDRLISYETGLATVRAIARPDKTKDSAKDIADRVLAKIDQAEAEGELEALWMSWVCDPEEKTDA